ncbi:hypothetical protein [Pseudalkalibacillus salsuginis]|uniref:hypothetical protein n=1 Tax=Pseudalkalibacillus salsuginis TaxID=2910972 RepID=UPI001F3D2C95|nr:hypothetical protein [Pseudalkalibacillus salsuginis]MCF6409564.1 hypothetical protein [Pseudalkalibacillus salsuginis]
MYFLKPISDEIRLSQLIFNRHNKTMKLILGSIFACIAAILQAAGGYSPGMGYFLSPLATGRSRTVDNIELDFDFSEVDISKTFTLIHILFLESDHSEENSSSNPDSKDKMPPYLQIFLPLFMVRFTALSVTASFRAPLRDGPFF